MLFVWIGKKGSKTESEPDQPSQPRFVFPITLRLLVGSLFSTLALVKIGAEQITGNYLSGLLFLQPPGVPGQVLVPLRLRTDVGG